MNANNLYYRQVSLEINISLSLHDIVRERKEIKGNEDRKRCDYSTLAYKCHRLHFNFEIFLHSEY